jgi:hypothetical protein
MNINKDFKLMTEWEQVAKESMPEPHSETMIKQMIKLETSDLIHQMAILESREMQRVMRFTNNDVELDVQEIDKYLKTILYLRVQQVNDSKFLKKYKFAKKNLNIPVRIYQILLSLGEAVDRDYGIRFVPAMDIDSEDLLSPEQLREYSDRMAVLIPEGYLVVETGLPTSTYGELGFMACLLVSQEKIYSYRKDHPVYGFIASFFKSELVNKAFDMDYRIYYGSVEDYKVMLSRIYRK